MERGGGSIGPPLLILLAAGLGAGAIAMRRRIIGRAERAVADRLVVGPAGIVRGAETIDLPGDQRRAVLLVHGLGDTPQTLGYLADHLHALGWSVRAPLLPGHGRSLREFALSSAEDWHSAVRAEYDRLTERHPRVAVVGLSMGGALAAALASDRRGIPALVLLAPYLGVPGLVRWLGRAHRLLDPVVPYFGGRGERSVRDDRERPKSRAYGYFSAGILRELTCVVERGVSALPAIESPTLLIQSRGDNRIAPDVAERAFQLLGAKEKELVWLDGSAHVITVDFEREQVFALTARWLEERVLRPTRARRD